MLDSLQAQLFSVLRLKSWVDVIAHGQIGSFVLGIYDDFPVALQDLLDELIDLVGEYV